jgi:hypothetical protein
MDLKTLGTVFAAAVAFAATQAGAQQVYKCQDAAGKVTYASNPCAELGMRSAGEVKESINVAPAYKAPPRPAEPPPATSAQSAPPAAAKAAEPERRCFKVKTAKGFATRCNDTPEDAAK